MELVIQLYQYKIHENEHPQRVAAKQFRQHEINVCFLWNLNNPIIQKIHVLLESDADLSYFNKILSEHSHSAECTFSVFGRQPFYADLVRYVHQTIEPGKIVCIQNSDIYFSHTIQSEFLEKILDNQTLITLTRHEETDPQKSAFEHDVVCNEESCPLIYDYQGSHDSFIFRTPIPETFPYQNVAIPQNVYGAEAVFLKAWKDCGKKLVNPCFDISIFHKHKYRTYFKEYETIANGYLANANPLAPTCRPDLQKKLKSIFPPSN
jgi:hypothetical protein